jgi:hypothetical protein
MPGPFTAIHRKEIFATANRRGVPTIYPLRFCRRVMITVPNLRQRLG